MDKTKKIRVAILYGGRSSEHEVSLASATNVMQHLDRSRFDVVPIGIDKQGSWFLGDEMAKLCLQRAKERQLFAPALIGQVLHGPPRAEKTRQIAAEVEHFAGASSDQDRQMSLLADSDKDRQISMLTDSDSACPLRGLTGADHASQMDLLSRSDTHGQMDLCAGSHKANPRDLLTDRLFDVVFPVIHGPFCEDGTVQGLLELADLPYVGCGVLSSAIGMDKDVSKRLVQSAGIPVAPYLAIKRGAWDKDPAHWCALIENKLRYPVFVKPSNAGSSIGITKVKQPQALTAAIQLAFQYDTKIVVEQGIDAIEVELAVLESLDYGSDPIVSVPGEVRPTGTHEFYSYASKYLDENGAELLIPAPISDALQEKVRRAAKDIFLALEGEGMARVDLFVERGTGQVYFNEINSIPGFTKISMYPKLMSASGMAYSELLSHLILLAIHRHTRKTRLRCDYAAE